MDDVGFVVLWQTLTTSSAIMDVRFSFTKSTDKLLSPASLSLSESVSALHSPVAPLLPPERLSMASLLGVNTFARLELSVERDGRSTQQRHSLSRNRLLLIAVTLLLLHFPQNTLLHFRQVCFKQTILKAAEQVEQALMSASSAKTTLRGVVEAVLKDV